MSTLHKWGAAVYDPHLGFVIAGGAVSSSVERTYDGISFSNLKGMPGVFIRLCLVSLQNGNLVALTQDDGTWMYHGSNNSWSTLTKQTDMPHKLSRNYFGESCGTTEEDGQVTEVVAVGGWDTPNDVFILNLESGAWRSGVIYYSRPSYFQTSLVLRCTLAAQSKFGNNSVLIFQK